MHLCLRWEVESGAPGCAGVTRDHWICKDEKCDKKRCAVLGIIATAKGPNAQQPWTAQSAVAPRVARAKPSATAVLPCSATTLALRRLAKYVSAEMVKCRAARHRGTYVIARGRARASPWRHCLLCVCVCVYVCVAGMQWQACSSGSH